MYVHVDLYWNLQWKFRPFEFSESFKEQPFSVIVASKLCSLAVTLGEVAFFGTYLKFMVERPNIKLKSTAHPHGIFE